MSPGKAAAVFQVRSTNATDPVDYVHQKLRAAFQAVADTAPNIE
jgi:hypothetical protein